MIFKFIPKGTKFFIYVPTADEQPKLIECSVIGNYLSVNENNPIVIYHLLTSEGELAVRSGYLYNSLIKAIHQSSYRKAVKVYKSVEDFCKVNPTVFADFTKDADTDKITFDFRGYIANNDCLYGNEQRSTAARLHYYYIAKGEVYSGSEDSDYLSYDEDIQMLTPLQYEDAQVMPCASALGRFNNTEDAFSTLLSSVNIIRLNGETQKAEQKMNKNRQLRKKVAAWAKKQQVSLDELKELLNVNDNDND